MLLELVDDGHEVIGVFTLLTDSGAIARKYIVKNKERKGHSLVLMRYGQAGFDDQYAAVPATRVINEMRQSNNIVLAAGAAERRVHRSTIIEYGFTNTMGFVQFIAQFSAVDKELLSGHWYVTEEGLNSHTRPAGKFSVEKVDMGISAEAKSILSEISNRR